MGLDKKRRSVLKIAGAGVTAGLAGCSSNSGSNDTNNSKDNPNSGGGKKFDGVTIEWWTWLNIESTTIKKGLQDTANQFEQDTGATVKINFAQGFINQGSKWPSTIKSGNVPHIVNYAPQMGSNIPRKYWYVHDDLVKDFSSAYDNVDLDAYKDRLSLDKYMARGWPDIDVITPLQLQIPRTVMLWRTDLWKKAGIMDKFPPKSMDELKQAARTIKEKTGVKAGFAPTGAEANYWFNERSAQGGPRTKTSMFNEDFSGMNVTNDAWLQPYKDAKTFANSNFVPQNTVSLPDEKTLALTGRGQYAGTTPDPMGHSLLLEQFPSVVKSGSIQWAPFNGWESKKGSPTKIWGAGNLILKDPDDRSQKRKRAEKAAVHFLTDYWLSKDFQANIVNKFGAFFPTRTDVFDTVEKNTKYEDKHHYAKTMAASIKASDQPVVSWGTKDIHWASANDPATPNWQKVYKGKKSPEEATAAWESTVTKQNNMG